jgi:hypothetical protein
MPFDALEGYMQEIEKRKVIYIEKPELSSDMIEELNYKLLGLSVGDMISLKYYLNGDIYHLTGEVLRINYDNKSLKVDKKGIKFTDILEIY